MCIRDRARNGLSIVIAPEGTRLDTTEVGPFKKGPFRMAMAAGIPIVPIVIRNAEIVAARNSTTINPGTVDVAVFPPIPVDDWTLDTLSDRIAEVRQLYLDTLADWPADELPKVGLYARAKKAAPKKSGQARARKATAKRTPARAAAKTTAKKAAKTPAKKTPAKKAPAKKAPAKKPTTTNPNESKVALKDGEAQQPDQTGATEATGSRPRGRP